MAKLYGLHRSTLYEAVAKGRVSAGHDTKGQRVIDLSEMIRVYGEPPSDTRHPTPTRPTAKPTPDSNALLTELVEINRQQAHQLERMAERIERLESVLLRLPAPDRQPTQPDTPEEPHRHKFSDLMDALRNSQS
ncbi:hypothetical protein [Vreelandella salicampi]|uniref:Uncharacterized protein n=1 Tax=Vreelandella salicampi TaxID=1449798 RepID=A0A7Z0LPB9_9GAMM|nr:hypothetical protein [Halomonas salicampi]NYS62596.1 hypothetical protein [Halomonas salicampi]